MDGEQVPGWPGDDAARDGAPLDVSTGRSDPRLIAAERVIRQLRALIGALALAAEHGDTSGTDADTGVGPGGTGTLDVPAALLRDPRVDRVHIQATVHGVQISLPAGPDESRSAADPPPVPPTLRHAAQTPAAEDLPRAGETALMRRLADLARRHAQGADQPEASGDGGADETTR